jgi:acetylcholinesterase
VQRPLTIAIQGSASDSVLLAAGLSEAGAARNPNYTEADLRRDVTDTLLPVVVDPEELDAAVSKLLELYPDIPALGSPYRTGDELFGLPSIFKRAASLCRSMIHSASGGDTDSDGMGTGGDMQYVVPRRQWMQTVIDQGQPAYGYLFSQPQNFTSPPDVGGASLLSSQPWHLRYQRAVTVPHTAEMPYLFGDSKDPTPGGKQLSAFMMDYWISFAVNLDPNDSKGVERTWLSVYINHCNELTFGSTANRPKMAPIHEGQQGKVSTQRFYPAVPDHPSLQVLLQLEGGNTTIIEDYFRKKQTDFLIANSEVFRR